MASKQKRSKFAKTKVVRQYKDKLCEELADVIEILTHSGNKTLNQNDFNKVTNICKRSDAYVEEAYNITMDHLKENHAEVRRSAVQIIDEMFRRSHCFRELLVSNLEQLIELTIRKELPPPKRVAQELKDLTVRSIHEWNTVFGDRYKRLSMGYDFLRRTQKDAFSILEVTEASSRSSQEANTQIQDNINRLKVKKVLAEMKDKEIDIRTSVTSLSNCINLLLPHPDDFFIMSEEDEGDVTEHPSTQPSEGGVIVHPSTPPSEGSDTVHPSTRPSEGSDTAHPSTQPSEGSDTDGEPDDAALREVGIHSINHSVELDFTPSSVAYIKETPDNADIIQNANESAKLIKNTHLKTVKNWLQDLSKSSGNKEVQKRLEELKGDIDDVVFKYDRMIFVTEDDVSSDSDLEEVKEIEPSSPTHSNKSDIKEESEKSKPSTSSEAVTRKERLLAIAPKRPFDVDLYHWEDEKLPVPTLIPSSTDGHRFWVGADSALEEIPVPGGSASLRTRVIEFTGSFTPVSHTCRVRLPSGKLCPRRDRLKCPFHGEIVPRDDTGHCINPQDALRMQQLAEKRQQERPDWQHPKLLAEIKKATGIDLKMPEKGKRKIKERKYPGLTDLKQLQNTASKRLEKKIFQKASMKRVAAAMDRLDQRKFKDKFGDQFNYFYNS